MAVSLAPGLNLTENTWITAKLYLFPASIWVCVFTSLSSALSSCLSLLLLSLSFKMDLAVQHRLGLSLAKHLAFLLSYKCRQEAADANGRWEALASASSLSRSNWPTKPRVRAVAVTAGCLLPGFRWQKSRHNS